MKAGGAGRGDAIKTELVSAQAQGTLPPPVKDPKVVGPIMQSVWQEYTATAEKFNDPGRFTAMIGFEWTSVPGGNNLHRNVLFRDNKDKADQILPFSAWQSEDPEKLWDWMDRYEKKTGGQLLAIPHNANLSNGRMFELVDFAGKPLSKDYAERRARWEVLQEVMQTKGNSETHPTLSPNDEFADFGIQGWDNGNLTLEGKPADAGDAAVHVPARWIAAGADAGAEARRESVQVRLHRRHRRAQLADRDRGGQLLRQARRSGAAARRAGARRQEGLRLDPLQLELQAAGYAAVWATENTREALWDAMKRKEVYATSGHADDGALLRRLGLQAPTMPARATSPRPATPRACRWAPTCRRPRRRKAPTFLVAAMKDALGGNLDRIQIVKGWVDKAGKPQEKIYDVVVGRRGAAKARTRTASCRRSATRWTSRTLPGRTRSVIPNSRPSGRIRTSTRRCAPSTTRASIEIPTPRWTAYDAVRFGVKMSPEVPMKHQERAWTSPDLVHAVINAARAADGGGAR